MTISPFPSSSRAASAFFLRSFQSVIENPLRQFAEPPFDCCYRLAAGCEIVSSYEHPEIVAQLPQSLVLRAGIVGDSVLLMSLPRCTSIRMGSIVYVFIGEISPSFRLIDSASPF